MQPFIAYYFIANVQFDFMNIIMNAILALWIPPQWPNS